MWKLGEIVWKVSNIPTIRFIESEYLMRGCDQIETMITRLMYGCDLDYKFADRQDITVRIKMSIYVEQDTS